MPLFTRALRRFEDLYTLPCTVATLFIYHGENRSWRYSYYEGRSQMQIMKVLIEQLIKERDDDFTSSQEKRNMIPKDVL